MKHILAVHEATTSRKKTWDIVPNLDVKDTYKVLAF